MSRPILKFVTGNKNKLKEVQQIFGQHFQIENVDLDLDEYQGAPEKIARRKCADAAKLIFKSTAADASNVAGIITEDTCLCFNALGGLPGPYVKYFLGNVGPDGLHKMLSAFGDKSAYALCTFALAERDGNGEEHIKLFEGRVDGTIVEPRGPRNFGWDPCFQPANFDKTFAEMDATEKNKISHRSLALKELKKYLDTLL